MWTVDARAGQKKKDVFKGKVLEVVHDGSGGIEIPYYFEHSRSQPELVLTN